MPYKILLVDDHFDAIHMLGLLLGLDGHDTRTAVSGEEGLRIAATWQPDVVFVDLGMPGMNGYEVASRLRQIEGVANSRIVAVSGYCAEWPLLRSAGIDHHVLKPVGMDELRTVLGQPQLRASG